MYFLLLTWNVSPFAYPLLTLRWRGGVSVVKSRCSGVASLLTWSESLDFCDLRAVAMQSVQPTTGPCLSQRVVVPHLLCFCKYSSVLLGKALAFVWPDKLNQESHLVKLFSLFVLFHPPLPFLLLFPLPLFFFTMTFFVLSFSARPVTWSSSPCTWMGSYTKTRDIEGVFSDMEVGRTIPFTIVMDLAYINVTV